jgi:putative toxin-antitoxin system antitoxin component (TIGR02293 family)
MVEVAAEVLGSRDEAMRWLGTPIRGLSFATPISLLSTEEGIERVTVILGQMEHGVW